MSWKCRILKRVLVSKNHHAFHCLSRNHCFYSNQKCGGRRAPIVLWLCRWPTSTWADRNCQSQIWWARGCLPIKCYKTYHLCPFPVDNNRTRSRKMAFFLQCETELRRKDLSYLHPLERSQKYGCGGNMEETEQRCWSLQAAWKFLLDPWQTKAILSEITGIFKIPFWSQNIPHAKYGLIRLE